MTKRQESGFNWCGVEFGPEECEARRRAREDRLSSDTQFFSHPQQSNKWFDELPKFPKPRIYPIVEEMTKYPPVLSLEHHVMGVNQSHSNINRSLIRAPHNRSFRTFSRLIKVFFVIRRPRLPFPGAQWASDSAANNEGILSAASHVRRLPTLNESLPAAVTSDLSPGPGPRALGPKSKPIHICMPTQCWQLGRAWPYNRT